MDKDIFNLNLLFDPDFRSELISDPVIIFRKKGIIIPEKIKIIVHENNSENYHFTFNKKNIINPFEVYSEPINKIRKKVAENSEFRIKLLSNPKDTLAPFFGSIPENIKIHIHENKNNIIHFVLPMMNEENDDELSDTELEAVAGGKGGKVFINIFNEVKDFGTRQPDYFKRLYKDNVELGKMAINDPKRFINFFFSV